VITTTGVTLPGTLDGPLAGKRTKTTDGIHIAYQVLDDGPGE